MLKKIAAAIILVCVSVVTTTAGAQPGWNSYRGRGRGYGRGRGRGRGWGHYQPDPGAVGGFLGGVFGSWLWNQLEKKEEPPKPNEPFYDEEEEDDTPRDSRRTPRP